MTVTDEHQAEPEGQSQETSARRLFFGYTLIIVLLLLHAAEATTLFVGVNPFGLAQPMREWLGF